MGHLYLVQEHLDNALTGDRQRVKGFWENLGGLGGNTMVSFSARSLFLANVVSRSINYFFAISIFLDQIFWETALRVGDGYV